jgi:hypothetical protein
MNFYRNAHYHIKNKLKASIEQHFKDSFTETIDKPLQKFKVHYKIYYKNPSCDPSNIVALVEKFFLDFAQDPEVNLIPEDNVLHHMSSSWEVVAQDKANPRCEVTITPIQ